MNSIAGLSRLLLLSSQLFQKARTEDDEDVVVSSRHQYRTVLYVQYKFGLLAFSVAVVPDRFI